jgi:hypothetical protein
LHEIISPVLTDIKPASLIKTYESNQNITDSDASVKLTKTSLNFLYTAFKDRSPGFKKYSVISLGHLVSEMLETYDLSSHAEEFANTYINFELKRIKNEKLPEENQDSRLAAYTDAARADSIQDLQYRHEELLNEFISHMPDLKLKDKTRNFTEEQRRAIFWKQKGTCQICGRVCRENEFHADHVLPWSKGNPTSLENGQVLCTECNLKKGNRG